MRFGWSLAFKMAPVPLAIMVVAVFFTSLFMFGGVQWSLGVRDMLGARASSMVGGELALRSNKPLQIREVPTGLSVSQALRLSTVLVSGERATLASVRFVDSKFPLRGAVVFAEQADESRVRPEPGEIWISEDLGIRLQTEKGQIIQLGGVRLRVTAILRWSPGLRSGFGFFLPWAIAAREDLQSSGLLQPGSRVVHEMYFSGPEEILTRWLEEQKPKWEEAGVRWTRANGSQWLGRTIERVEGLTYTMMASLVLLGMASIWLSVQAWSKDVERSGELLSALGLNPWQRWLWLANPVLLTTGTAGLLGMVSGSGLLSMLRAAIAPEFLWDMPVWSLQASLVAILWVIFPLWYLLLLIGPGKAWSWRWRLVSALGLMAVLVYGWHQLNPSAMGSFLKPWLAVAGAGLVMLLLLRWLILLIRAVLPERGLVGLMVLSMKASWRTYTAQWSMLFVGLLLSQTIALFSESIQSDWRTQWPASTPNVFLFNVFPDQKGEVENLLEASSSAGSHPVWYPIARGRIVAVDGMSVIRGALANGIEDSALKRDLNVTWSETLPENNVLVAGRHWQGLAGPGAEDAWPVSVEEGVAQRLGLKVGSQVVVRFGTKNMVLKVHSLRRVDWSTLKPNFFFILQPGPELKLPHTWLTAVHIEEQQIRTFLSDISAFPTVSVVDVSDLLKQIRTWMSAAIVAMTWSVALLTLMALLLTVSVTAFGLHNKRAFLRQLRIQGAGMQMLRRWMLLDITLIALSAWLIAWALSLRFFFWLPNAPGWDEVPWMWMPVSALLAWLLQGALHWPLLRGHGAKRS